MEKILPVQDLSTEQYQFILEVSLKTAHSEAFNSSGERANKFTQYIS